MSDEREDTQDPRTTRNAGEAETLTRDAPTEDQLSARESAIERKQAEQWERFVGARLPSPKSMYRMGDDELMHHVHLFALQRILESFGVTEREVTLVMNEIMYEECEKIYEEARKQRRKALTQGIGTVPKPII